MEERSTTGQSRSVWRRPLSWKWLEAGRWLAEKINYVHPIVAIFQGSVFHHCCKQVTGLQEPPKIWNNNTVLIFLFELWVNCISVFWCVDEFKVLWLPISAWAGGESTAGSSDATVPLGSRSFCQLVPMAMGTRCMGRHSSRAQWQGQHCMIVYFVSGSVNCRLCFVKPRAIALPFIYTRMVF